MIQSILCLHPVLKLKILNISSCVCHFYSTVLFENLENVEPNFLSLSAKNQDLILLHRPQTNNSESLNQDFLKNATSYLKATDRFQRS